MIPIQDLLNRIRWDKEFGRGQFEIGFLDRVEDRIIKVPFSAIRFPAGEHFSFQVANESDEEISIPLHRVRKVWKDGILIWQRKGGDP